MTIDFVNTGERARWDGAETSFGETVSVESLDPKEGTFHGYFSSNGGGGYDERAYCYKTLSSDELYARGYFYVNEGLPTDDENDRFYFIRFRGGSEWLAGVGVRRNNSIDSWVLYTKNGTDWSGPYINGSTVVRARARAMVSTACSMSLNCSKFLA